MVSGPLRELSAVCVGREFKTSSLVRNLVVTCHNMWMAGTLWL